MGIARKILEFFRDPVFDIPRIMRSILHQLHMESQESRRARFLRLATKRTNFILQKIRILGNCANKSQYDYSEEEVNKIFTAIEEALRDAKARFSTKKSKSFSL